MKRSMRANDFKLGLEDGARFKCGWRILGIQDCIKGKGVEIMNKKMVSLNLYGSTM